MYTILANNMTQVLNFIDTKRTFRLFKKRFCLGEEIENLIHMGEMGLPSFTIDENIIKENQEKMMEERTKNIIHETLESGGGITQEKWNYQELIVTLMSSKCSLGNVFLFHTYLVVAITNNKFSKVPSTTQFIQQIINDRNGKFVFDGEFVQGEKV